MKKITLALAILFATQLFSQVTLDNEYDGNLRIVKFSEAGEKIVTIITDRNYPRTVNTIIKIYSLDNSIYKTINVGNTDDVIDVSQHIVNTNDKIEVMLSHYANNNGDNYFYIIDEDLNEIFKSENGWNESESPLDGRGFDNQFIYATSEGLKFVLGNYDNATNSSKTRVYSLGGNATLSNKEIDIEKLTAYPNPANEVVNIKYTALNNEVVTIKIFDLNGKLIEVKKVDNQFDKLRLYVTNYTQGVYLYTVENSLGSYNGKFVKE